MANIVKIVLGGYYGFENAGDELILAAIVREFRRACPSGRLVVLSSDPEKTQRLHGVEVVNRWNPFQIFTALKGADRFILGGGGLFQDTTSLRSFFYYLALLMMAETRAKSVALFAVGVENIRTRWAQKILTTFLRRAKILCTVRDEESARHLMNWGLPSDQVRRSPDATFLFGPVPRASTDSKSLILIPRFPVSREGERLYQNLFSAVRRLELVWQVLLLHPSLETKMWISFAQRNHLEPDLISWNHPSELTKQLSEASLVISARYHGLLISEMAGVPTVGLGLEEKAGRYCQEWNRPFLPWNSSPEKINQALSEAIESGEARERHPEIAARSEEARASFREVFVFTVENS